MQNKYGNNQTRKLTMLALFVAILIIQTFVPGLGYIPIGPLNATIIQVTVIIGGIFFGKRMGLALGTVWGILSLVRSLVTPNPLTPVIVNPLISVLPRMIVGLASAALFIKLKDKWNLTFSASLVGAVGSLMNTVLFLGAIYLFAAESYAAALNIEFATLLTTLAAVVVSNGIPEAIVSAIVTPLIVLPLYDRVSKRYTF